MFKIIQKNKGFTLIEVVAALVMITIVLLSFAQLFVQTNKTAVYNNEKLVVINLAQAELERLKIDPFNKDGSDIDGKINKPNPSSIKYSDKTDKKTTLNKRDYTIFINASQSDEEKKLKLINITVEAVSSDGKTKNSVEGYIEYDL